LTVDDVGLRRATAADLPARPSGCGLLQLTTDRKRLAAHRFYERIGYEPSHIGMKKKL
jgi:hypothetical protein